MNIIKVAALSIMLALGGCQTIDAIGKFNNAVQGFEATQGDIDAARTSYNASVLTPMLHYSVLVRCKKGQIFTFAVPCHDAAILKKWRGVDAEIAAGLDRAQVMVTNGNNKGAAGVMAVVFNLISTGTSLVKQAGIGTSL
jgi:hypothetical protein